VATTTEKDEKESPKKADSKKADSKADKKTKDMEELKKEVPLVCGASFLLPVSCQCTVGLEQCVLRPALVPGMLLTGPSDGLLNPI
jgi:hypothetical protein